MKELLLKELEDEMELLNQDLEFVKHDGVKDYILLRIKAVEQRINWVMKG